MFTEGAFGLLTAGAEVLLPYLLISLLSQGGAFDPTLETVLIIALLVAEPLAVSQTIMGIANGSHYYTSEAWPSMLPGLAAGAAVLGVASIASPGMFSSTRVNGAPDPILPLMIAEVFV